MSTLNWLELLLAITIAVGTFMYYFGFAMGREQDKKDQEARRASMRNHPSYALRVKQWEEEKD